MVEKNLKWRIHYHADVTELASTLEQAQHPPYFFCIKDRHMLPTEVLKAVALQGGYFYEGLPSDPEKLLKTIVDFFVGKSMGIFMELSKPLIIYLLIIDNVWRMDFPVFFSLAHLDIFCTIMVTIRSLSFLLQFLVRKPCKLYHV